MLINKSRLLFDLLELLPVVLPSVSINELRELPRSSALYLWSKEDVVLYVGLTHDLRWRYNNQNPHKLKQLRDKGAERVSWITLKNSRSFDEMDDAKILEAALIKLYQPSLNIEYNSKFKWANQKRPSKRLI